MRTKDTVLVFVAVGCVLLGLAYFDSKRQPAEQAAAPATSCELDLIEARDYIGDLLQERDALEARVREMESAR